MTSSVDFEIFTAITDDDHENTENVTMRFQLHPSDDGIVNLKAIVESIFNGLDFNHGGVGELTPQQAESMAAALVKAAEQARQGGAYKDRV